MILLNNCKNIKKNAVTSLALLLFVALSHTAIRAEEATIQELLEFQLPELEKAPWRFKKFPILAWWAPAGTATLEDFENYRDAGFTLYPLNPDSGYEAAMQKAKEAGLPIIGFRETQGFQLPAIRPDFPTDDPDVIGWITHDEPGPPHAVIESIKSVHTLMQQDPTRWALFNFFPPHAQPEPGTEAAARVALRNGLPILSYDHYVMRNDGTTRREQHFENLELFSRLAKEFDVPFWAFALSIEHYSYRRPSESDVRWKQFTNLAYGAKGLWYFTYWAPAPSPDWSRWKNTAIVSHTGEKTDLYGVARDINLEVGRIGELLLGLTNETVVHLHPPEGSRRFEPSEHWISGVEAEDVIIGFFKDERGGDYAWVVNNWQGPGKLAADLLQDVKLQFAPEVKAVEAVSYLDSTPGPLALNATNGCTLTLSGGTGILLKTQIE